MGDKKIYSNYFKTSGVFRIGAFLLTGACNGFHMLNLVITAIATVLVVFRAQGANSSLSGASLVTLLMLSQPLGDLCGFMRH